MTRIAIVITAGLAFAATLSVIPAYSAARDRVFVASYGSDSNPCTFGSPCKTFQQAVNTVAQGGEVTAIDSAGFGPITISHAITITSPNGVEAGIATPSGGIAIAITAAGASDIINLNGLTLDGVGGANTGIQFNSGGSLNVKDSIIRNFTNNGINFTPSVSTQSQLSVSSTLVADNGLNGIEVLPSGSGTVTAVFNRIEVKNNGQSGILLNGNNSTGTINATVSESVATGNSFVGLYAFALVATPITLNLFHSVVANNADGIETNATNAILRVAQSMVTGNAVGWITGSGTGVIETYGDNYMVGNGPNTGSLSSISKQ